MVNTQTYKHFLRNEYLVQQSSVPRNSCSKFQGNRSVLSYVKGCGYLTATRYLNSSLSYFIRRSDFQAKILKVIHNNYYELQEYKIHALSISAASDRSSIAIISFKEYLRMPLQSLGNKCFFKHMNFNGYEFFRTVSVSYFKLLSYLVARIINQMIIFLCFTFSISIKLVLWL